MDREAFLFEHMARVSGNTFKVLAVYSKHANIDGRAWPSDARVMELTGIKTPKTLRACRKELADLGIMEVAVSGKAIRTVSTYALAGVGITQERVKFTAQER